MGMAATVAVVCALAWEAAFVQAQDKVVVVPLMGDSTPAPVAKTGQTTSYASGDDGDHENGVAWPVPRFTNNGNGTVTDHLTGLVWLTIGNCIQFYAGDPATVNQRSWDPAVESVNRLASGFCGLTDGSRAGDWRLPNRKELDSLIDLGQHDPALPSGCPLGMESKYYWSSTTCAFNGATAWWVHFDNGTSSCNWNGSAGRVRAVRGGQ